VRLDPLPAALVDRFLEARGVAADVRAAIVPRADGSLGRAAALVDDPHAEARRRMLDQLGGLGRATAAELSGTAQALGRDDVETALAAAASWYRDLLTLVAGGSDDGVRNLDVTAPLRTSAAGTSVPRVLRALDTVCDTIRAVEGNANKVLALETMLLALRRLERAPHAE
jgi:hypothetical protein